ncbi:hypothetical protein Cni_G19825 [Canna indica]|uniref:Peptidase A1 domain-containing protein n=1 Tax=Canna indica TaxID=4628 RepID=A0AAQ3KM02_9LILI|nr:hypothetical protein Cni_G19825 [Canna indica]
MPQRDIVGLILKVRLVREDHTPKRQSGDPTGEGNDYLHGNCSNHLVAASLPKTQGTTDDEHSAFSSFPCGGSKLSCMQASANKLLFCHNISHTIPLFVGSPPQNVSMVLDIGSELSWLICNSCSAVALTSFDPNRSFTYSPITCSSPTCRDGGHDLPMPPMCDASSQTPKARTATYTSPTLTPPPLMALSPPTNSSWAGPLCCPPSSAAWV